MRRPTELGQAGEAAVAPGPGGVNSEGEGGERGTQGQKESRRRPTTARDPHLKDGWDGGSTAACPTAVLGGLGPAIS